MFDIAWTEILLVAVVAIVVFPSKDLPKLLRSAGQAVGKFRRMAGDFQSQFNSALREAEREADLMDTKKQFDDLRSINPLKDVKSALNPLKSAGEDLGRDLRNAAEPMRSPAPASGDVPVVADPVKTGHAAGPAAAIEPPLPTVSVPMPEVVPPPSIPTAGPVAAATAASPPPPAAAKAPESAPAAPQQPAARPQPAAPPQQAAATAAPAPSDKTQTPSEGASR